MTVYISGGSNSLLKKGWTRRIKDLVPDKNFVNISIGATCSVTGLYRSLFTVPLSPGDTLIWEYALNDCNHVDLHGLSEKYLLRYLEILLAECALRKIKFVGLIFKSLPQESQGYEPSYHRKIINLFNHWKVVYINISEEYRKFIGYEIIPKEYYEEPNHYNTQSKIIDFIENKITSALTLSTVPQKCNRMHSEATNSLAFIDTFSGGVSELSGTSWFSSLAWRPSPKLSVQAGFDGILVSAITFSGLNGGGFKLSCGANVVEISSTLTGPASMKHRLSPAFLDPDRTSTLKFCSNDIIDISWSDSSNKLISGTFNKRNLTPAELSGRSASLLGLLVLRL